MADTSSERSCVVRSRQVGRAPQSEQELLEAAAAVFGRSGVHAPVREIAADGGVGVGALYRHFPTGSELLVEVYRRQVEACVEAGPSLLAESRTPEAALRALVRCAWSSSSPNTGLRARCKETGPRSTL